MAHESDPSGSFRRRLGGHLLSVLAVALLLAALLLPDRIERITPVTFLRLPLEALVLGLVLVFTAGTFARIVQAVLAFALAVAVVFKLADMAAFAAYARPFNPILDFHLLGAAWNLLSGAVGTAGAAAAAAAAALAVVLIVVIAGLATGRAARALRSALRPAAAVLLLAAGAWAALWVFGRPEASWSTSRMVRDHAATVVASLHDLDDFRRAAAVDRYREVPGDRLLTALKGHDVLVIFVESYGRTVFGDPRYAPSVLPVLERGSRDLAAAGFGVRSAWLTSPTVGGMSWLAHGTALAGLWADNQRRYENLVVSDRMTLNTAFRKAGWRTVAVMPAIVMAWPEGGFFGYDRIYAAADLGYRGKPFNWVTMPDQYTLAAFERLERTPGARKPVMAEIALISSHAPWTPIPTPVPWEAVGDGTIFDTQAEAGDPPSVVWRDPDRVRLQYRLSIEYALANLVSYLTTHGDDRLVTIILGDHQPAPMLTGDAAGRDVPVHFVAKDPAVLAAIADWGWTDGLVPRDGAPVWPMSDFRDRILQAFSPAAGK